MGIRTPLLKPDAPMRKFRPTPVAMREMRKCRKLLGLPKREPRH
jgi:hypothetical protein